MKMKKKKKKKYQIRIENMAIWLQALSDQSIEYQYRSDCIWIVVVAIRSETHIPHRMPIERMTDGND